MAPRFFQLRTRRSNPGKVPWCVSPARQYSGLPAIIRKRCAVLERGNVLSDVSPPVLSIIRFADSRYGITRVITLLPSFDSGTRLSGSTTAITYLRLNEVAEDLLMRRLT